MNEIIRRIKGEKKIPIAVIKEKNDTDMLIDKLMKMGYGSVEVTFRTDKAVDAISKISKNNSGMLIGAGTVQTIKQAKEAVEAGASFIVTPGFNQSVVEWCMSNNTVIIPGVATPTEIENAITHGLNYLKLFPVDALGGIKLLRAYAGPYKDVCFMPTGGVNERNVNDYLEEPNVFAVGGSWMLR